MRLASTPTTRPQALNTTPSSSEERDRRDSFWVRKFDISLSHGSVRAAGYEVEASIVYTATQCILYTHTYTPALWRLSTNVKALLRYALACQQRSLADQHCPMAPGGGMSVYMRGIGVKKVIR